MINDEKEDSINKGYTAEKLYYESIDDSAELKNRNDQLVRIANIIRDDIREIYDSWSWKITTPFRAAINLLTLGRFEGDIPVYLQEKNPYEELLLTDEELLRKAASKKDYEDDIAELLEQYNPKPWKISLKERVSKLENDIDQGKKVVVHMYDAADSSTFRYACYNVCQYTKDSAVYRAHYFFGNECSTVARYLDKIKLLVLCRTKWRLSYVKLINAARENGIKVIMQIDDLVCSMDYLDYILEINLDKQGSEYIYDAWFANVSRLERIAKMADGFIVTNAYLGEKLKRIFDKDYSVIRNSLNAEQVSVSEKISKIKETKKKDKFVIGYFSGSYTHRKDLALILGDIKRLLDNFEDMTFMMVGYMKLPEELKKYIKAGRIVIKPFVNFIELQYLISIADINLVPLEDNYFTNCKSELKFFEAAIVDTITIATPTYTYKNAILDKNDGFLCEEGEWYQTIADIYDGKYDIDAMKKRAKEKTLSFYSGSLVLDEIETTYNALIGD